MGWAQFVDLIHGLLLAVSTAFGGSMGWAIAVVSLAVRVALLPLTLRLAYRGLEMQAAIKRLEPERARLRARYKKDQRRLWEETARLYQEHGIKLADGRSLLGMVLQLPVFVGLFGAIQRGLVKGGAFLWVKNIGAPDLPLTAVCAVLTAASSWVAPEASASQRAALATLSAVLTLLFLSRLAAGLSIYALAQGAVGLGQAFVVGRKARQIATASTAR